MIHRERLDQIVAEEGAYRAVGYDDCIVGICDNEGVSTIVYDSEAMIAKIAREEGLDRDDAEQFFQSSVVDVYGSGGPLFMTRLADGGV